MLLPLEVSELGKRKVMSWETTRLSFTPLMRLEHRVGSMTVCACLGRQVSVSLSLRNRCRSLITSVEQCLIHGHQPSKLPQVNLTQEDWIPVVSLLGNYQASSWPVWLYNGIFAWGLARAMTLSTSSTDC